MPTRLFDIETTVASPYMYLSASVGPIERM